MAYSVELNDLDIELRYGETSNQYLYHHPKAHDKGSILVSGSSCDLYRPGETTSFQTSAVNIPTVIGGAWHRLFLTLNLTNTTTWPRGEGYRAVWTGVYAGIDGQNLPYKATQFFAVVREPWQQTIGMSDLAEEDVGIIDILTRQAALLDSVNVTPQQFANAISVKAWLDVKLWIKSQILPDASYYPRLMIDQQAIRQVVIAKTISRIYRAEGVTQESESGQLHAYWDREAKARFKAIPASSYDYDDDGFGDSEIETDSSLIPKRKAW